MTAASSSSSTSCYTSPAMTTVATSSNPNTNASFTGVSTNASNSTTTPPATTANTSVSTSSFGNAHGSLSFASSNTAGKGSHGFNTKLMRVPASFHGKGSGGSSSSSLGLNNSVNSSSFYHRSLATVLEMLMSHEDVYYDTKTSTSNEAETIKGQSNGTTAIDDEVFNGANHNSHQYQHNSSYEQHNCESSDTSHYDKEAALHVYSVVANLLAKELINIYVRNIHTLSPQSVP